MIKQAYNYLKWAFIEAANAVVRHRRYPSWKPNYLGHAYERACRRKGPAVAVGAAAGYLAQSTYWVLRNS